MGVNCGMDGCSGVVAVGGCCGDELIVIEADVDVIDGEIEVDEDDDTAPPTTATLAASTPAAV